MENNKNTKNKAASKTENENIFEQVVRAEAAHLYPDNETDDGLMPRCTPANLAGGEYSTFPANKKSDEKADR